MPANPPLTALTGLRFFAALAIFNIHTTYFIQGPDMPDWRFLHQVASGEIAGVSLFFVLSGFILAYSHNDASISRHSLVTFWIGRLSRIYPVYFLALIWYAPFILTHRFAVEPTATAFGKSLASFVPSVFLVQSWIHPRSAIAWNGPGWTLSVEAVFYLLFPFMASRIRLLPRRALPFFALGLWCLSLTLTLSASRILTGWNYATLFVSVNPLFHLPTFGVGIALGYHFLGSNMPIKRTSWLAVLGLGTILLLTLFIDSFPDVVIHNCLFVPAFCLLIYGLAQGARTSAIFSLPALVLLGEASYGFYILQFPQGMTFRWLNEGMSFADRVGPAPSGGILHGWIAYTVLLLLTSASSIAIFKCFEVPMRLSIRRYAANFSLKPRAMAGVSEIR
jgi:peptidoglycan/LPS O-acetylase OafA/YrhL